MCTHMGTRNISLTDEAYERLKERKEGNESFTDVVLRLTSEDPEDFSGIVGAGIEASFGELEKSRKRSDADDRRERILDG